MMRAFILACLSLLLYASTANAAVCPKGTIWDAAPVNGAPSGDGCNNAPSDGVVQFPNFFNASSPTGYLATSGSMLANQQGYVPPFAVGSPPTQTVTINGGSVIGRGIARQSGQAPYKILPPYNVAGVDYPVGYSPSQVAAAVAAATNLTPVNGWKDPAQIASDNGANTSGCAYNATGSSFGGAQVTCTGGSNIRIEGYDFGLHNCTKLVFTTTTSGTITVKNNRWIMGPGCASTMFGKGDVNGLNVNSNSPGGAHVTGSFGTIFTGYFPGGNTSLCVTNTLLGPSTLDIGSSSNLVWYPSPSYSTSAGWVVAQPGTASCPSGGTPYQLNQTNSASGSFASPITLGESTNKFTITAIDSGTPNIGQTIQTDDNTLLPGQPAVLGYTVTACPGGPCTGQTGAYTLNAIVSNFTAVSASFAMGDASIGPANDGAFFEAPPNSVATIVDVEQNVFDGNNIQYPMRKYCCVADLGNTGGTAIFKYNAIFNTQSRAIGVNATNFYMDYNYIEGMQTFGTGHNNLTYTHYETYLFQPQNIGTPSGSGPWLIENINNTILNPANAAIGGTAFFYANNSVSTVDWHYYQSSHLTLKFNTLVNNLNPNPAFSGLLPMANAWFLGDWGYYMETVIDRNFVDPTGFSSSCAWWSPSGNTWWDTVPYASKGTDAAIGTTPNQRLSANFALTSAHPITQFGGGVCN